jgi:asparagine synthase (glutamine-hydrolysing)
MCGIFGVASESVKDVPLEQATNTLFHRGPDEGGIYHDDHVGLGHRRLSIIDLSSGQQPMFNEDRSQCVVFNGEIYNFLELRDELIAKGHVFATKSDTETILHAYEEWGERSVERFRGMFAFAVWDKKQKKLFLARDRFGIKPLFYAARNGRLYFASEMKAILASGEIDRQMDEEAIACYFTLSYIPGPLTIFKGIRKLLPGHTLTWQNGIFSIRKYWDLSIVPDRGKTEREFIDGFMDLFQGSVQSHLISDVPLGAFLSGGIDSSAVVAMMSAVSSGQVNTFSIGFGGDTGGYLDERCYARMVAERYATNHHEYEVLPEPQGIVEKIVRSFDEPFADDSAIPSYYVCKIARENVKVALSGLGGDEAFGGYERYLGFRLRGLYNRLPGFVRGNIIQKFVEGLAERPDGHYTINHMKRFVRSSALSADTAYFGYISRWNPSSQGSLFADAGRFQKHHESCKELMLSYFNSTQVQDTPDSLNRVLYSDIKTYLPDDILTVTDRMSMYHALEVRVPFVDHKVLEFCSTIPPEMKLKWFRKKYLLKKAVAPLLPKEVIDHRKQGFVGPMTRWLQTDLKQYVLDTLDGKNLNKHGLLNARTVKRITDEHFSGKEIHDTLIWSLVIFQKWFDTYGGKQELPEVLRPSERHDEQKTAVEGVKNVPSSGINGV